MTAWVRLLFGVIAALSGLEVFHYLRALNLDRPLLAKVESSPAGSGRRLARRVVWVLIDGLRLDASRRMKELASIRRSGLDVSATAHYPTYSIPNWVAQASGLRPTLSGVRTNSFTYPIRVDHVFVRARQRGLRTAVVAKSLSWTKYFGPWLNTRVPLGKALPEGDLVVVHLDYPDNAAHAHGAASEDYRRAVERADAALEAVVRQLDHARDALVVSSDHGHLDRGGHGGGEREVVEIPIVVWGSGVSAGRRQNGRAVDVGPTLAALLGLGPLDHAEGGSLLGPSSAEANQRRRVAAAAARGMGMRVSGVARPLALAIGLMITLLCAVIVWRARPGAREWWTASLYLFVLAGLYATTDTISFSSTNEKWRFILRFVGLASAAAVVQLVVGGRRSAVVATLLACFPLLPALWIAPERPVATLAGPGWTFYPVLAFGALGVIAGWTAAWGRSGGSPPRESTTPPADTRLRPR